MKTLAIIFDLDGVLVPTNILHRECLEDAIFNISGIKAEICQQSSLSSKQKLSRLAKDHNILSNQTEEILKLKDVLFKEKIKNLKLEKNVEDCLIETKARGILTAIASNSRLINILNISAITGLDKYIDVMVSADEVANPKPAPDILFEVYRRLRLRPTEYNNTIFVEDSDEGARAGYQSPSTVVKINDTRDLSFDLFKKWIK
jgi:HAD superfamily hydrolase (TIGR01509 family)